MTNYTQIYRDENNALHKSYKDPYIKPTNLQMFSGVLTTTSPLKNSWNINKGFFGHPKSPGDLTIKKEPLKM